MVKVSEEWVTHMDNKGLVWTYRLLQDAISANSERGARIKLPRIAALLELLYRLGMEDWDPIRGVARGSWMGKTWRLEFGDTNDQSN